MRPTDDRESWAPDDPGLVPGDCWAMDWVEAVGFVDGVRADMVEGPLVAVPVDVTYDECVEVSVPAPEPGAWPQGAQTIPRYAMLDIWVALYGPEASPAFDAFADAHGYAETWAFLCACARAPRVSPSLASQRPYLFTPPDGPLGPITAATLIRRS